MLNMGKIMRTTNKFSQFFMYEMETIESRLNFIDIVEVNEYEQIGFIDSFEQMRKGSISIYREKFF